MSTSAALVASGLEKRYRSVAALAGVDLSVERGELVGLLGPNGAGKSTLVKIACGLVRASGGSVSICGSPAGSRVARAGLGYLAELFRFPGWCTAAEVLELHQRLARSPGGGRERDELLELVGLADAAQRRVDEMSKGMQQRLGLAQALIGAPQLLLLDEPTSALDPAGRRAVRLLLEELRSRRIAVLLNSHLLSEIELVCDRVVILSRGKVVAEGRPHELTKTGGIEVETGSGVTRYPGAAREDAPRIVRELVAAGEQIYEVRDAALDARGRLSGGGGLAVTGALIVARHVLQESVRRRVFAVVLVLTVAFLALFAFATIEAFDRLDALSPGRGTLDTGGLATVTLVGLGMFATLFLGTVLAVFLTLGAVRGDAERGLLQPLVVRPLGRSELLIGRFAGAAGVCAVYVVIVYTVIVVTVHAAGGRWPDRVLGPGATLVGGVTILVALSLLGSVLLSATANGIAMFMVFGAGLVAGLLNTIGNALGSQTVQTISHDLAIAMPFEALYQAGLHALAANQTGFNGLLVNLGPFGSAHAGGPGLDLWAVVYVLAVGAAAILGFARRDL